MPREDLIQLRRGTAAQWTSANPVLADGEKGIETDTLKEKIGDGVTNWNSLSYFNDAGGGGTVDAFSDVANGDAFAPSNYTVDPEDTSLLGQLNGVNNQFGANNNAISNLQSTKQDTLVSGTNIKTVNGETLLGSGDLTVSGGFTQVAYSTALSFASNQISSFGDVTDNSHTQSGAITFTYDFTNAVEGSTRIVEILSDGNTWTLPTSQNGTRSINLNSETLISKNLNVITPISGERYQLNFDYSNGQIYCYVIDVNIFTNDVTPPTFTTAPTAENITTSSFDVEGQTDENTTVYAVVVADGATAPNASEIISGTGSGGSGELASGNDADVGLGFSISMTGLSSGTDVDTYVIAVDGSGNQSTIVQLDVSLPANTLPTGNIVSEWRNEGNANDSVGANNGVNTSITYVSGLVGQTAVYAGGSNYMTVADANDLSFGSAAYSFSFLVRFNNTSNQWIVSKRDAATNDEYQFSFTNNTTWAWRAFDEVNGGYLETRATVSPTNTLQWYHVVITSAGGANQPKLYIDGVDSGSANNSGTYVSMQNGTNDLIFGTQSWNLGNDSLNGDLDQQKIWNVELTAAQALELANLELAGTQV